jgi:hypothetical protein
MLASEFFTQERLKQMRDEICEEGFVADKFLADKPDCLVFGVNLACLYPFPPAFREGYQILVDQLANIDPIVYVYPLWETHVTIATFINFAQHTSPTEQCVAELTNVMEDLGAHLQKAFTDIKPFELWIEPPIISRKAAILPLSDATGAITETRKRVAENLPPSLRARLDALGFNIPPLVHSTIMRFKQVPVDTERVLAKFDAVARTVPRATMTVNEIYITTETKPYMREGEIFHRFQL